MAGPRTVVVGGGIAGAAVAWRLARAGAPVLLVERETAPGAHATGRNAAILRTAIADAPTATLARRGAAFLAAPPEGFAPVPLLRRTGVVLAAPPDAAERVLDCARGREDLRPLADDALRRLWPSLHGGIGAAVLAPEEGVLDGSALLSGFLAGARAAGARIATATAALALETALGRVTGVRLRERSGAERVVPADAVVLAGGAWAAEPAAAVGLGLPLTPRRRHLFLLEPTPAPPPDAPVLWLLGDAETYVRPESGGLLLSPCDERAVAPDACEREAAEAWDLAAARLGRWFPALASAPVRSHWAGGRTFAPDGRFVLGPDPRVEGLHWAAALGGHGMTCAAAVGELVADQVLGRARPEAEPFAPARLVTDASATAGAASA